MDDRRVARQVIGVPANGCAYWHLAEDHLAFLAKIAVGRTLGAAFRSGTPSKSKISASGRADEPAAAVGHRHVLSANEKASNFLENERPLGVVSSCEGDDERRCGRDSYSQWRHESVDASFHHLDVLSLGKRELAVTAMRYAPAARYQFPRLLSIQLSISAAISRLFFSIIIMWPFPWVPTFPSRTWVFGTPACVRYSEVQWSYGAWYPASLVIASGKAQQVRKNLTDGRRPAR